MKTKKDTPPSPVLHGSAIGGMLGSVCPVAGNAVGIVAGFVVGVSIYYVTDVITYNGKTARNWAKEGVNRIC